MMKMETNSKLPLFGLFNLKYRMSKINDMLNVLNTNKCGLFEILYRYIKVGLVRVCKHGGHTVVLVF